MSKHHGDKDTEPQWPTVEEQLSASKIVPGSALEKLVLENQNFEMLRPEEAHDKLRLPLWLRVHWRKHHPEANYGAHDPTGGYPLALRDLYNWMIRHQDLPLQQGSESGKEGGHGN